jgi:hypothetical protein
LKKKRSSKKRIDRRKVHGKVDPVRVQVAVRVKKPRGVKITKAFLKAAVQRYADTGRAPRGVQIVTIRWINPVRKDPSKAVWKSSEDSGQSLSQARATLRRLLRRIPLQFSHVR